MQMIMHTKWHLDEIALKLKKTPKMELRSLKISKLKGKDRTLFPKLYIIEKNPFTYLLVI